MAAAEAVLSEGVRRFPSHPWVRLQHAEVASQAEKWEEALKRWEQFAVDFPSMPDGFFRSASAALKLGRTDKDGFAIAQDALARWPGSEMALSLLPAIESVATAALMRGDEMMAEQLVLAGVALFPESPSLALRYGGLAAQRDDWVEARARFLSALE